MTAPAYFLLVALVILSVCLILAIRSRRRDSDVEDYSTEHGTSSYLGRDYLTSELSARIFYREDSDFIATETSRHVTRHFRRERIRLALDWLHAVRSHVNRLMGVHLRASRENSGLKPADEMRVWIEFVLFQLTSGILYLVIWTCGPPRAADLVAYFLELGGQLRRVTQDVLPAGHETAAELIHAGQGPGAETQ